MTSDGFSIGFRFPRSVGYEHLLEKLSEALPGAELFQAALFLYLQENDVTGKEETELLSIENLPLETGKNVWRTLRTNYSFLALLSENEPVVLGGWIERCSDPKPIGSVDANGILLSGNGKKLCRFSGKPFRRVADRIDGFVFAFPSPEYSARIRCCRTAAELQSAGEGSLFRLIPLCDCETAVRAFTSDLHGRYAYPIGKTNPVGLLPDRTAIVNPDRISAENELHSCLEYASGLGYRMMYAVSKDGSRIGIGNSMIETRTLSMDESGKDVLNDVLCGKLNAFRGRAKRWFCCSNAEDARRFNALWNASGRTVDFPEKVAIAKV